MRRRYATATFAFAVTLGAADEVTVRLFHPFLGVGRVRRYPARAEHDDDEVVFAVRAIPELVGVVVPFMDAHLPSSHERRQHEAWGAELLAHDARRPGGQASAAQSRVGTSRQRRSRS